MLSNVSHEFRTPLNAIISSTDMTQKFLGQLKQKMGK